MRKAKKKLYAPTLVLAASLFLYAAYSGAPQFVVRDTGNMLANATVGASASVPPNEYNTLAAQLADKQNQLASREQEVSLREAEAQSRGGGNLAIYSLIASLVLALLVAMNFYFDLRRDRLRKGQSGIAQIIKLQRRG